LPLRTRRAIVFRFHIPFWKARKAGREMKKPFPPAQRNGQLS
jgi:hypothetical protein